MGRRDRQADIGEHVHRRDQTAIPIGMLDRQCRRYRRRRATGAADQDASFLPGLVKRRAGRARELESQGFGSGLDAPGDAVRQVDGASSEDVNSGHEPGMTRASASQDLEVLARAAQQNQRGGVARTDEASGKKLICTGRRF